MLLEQTKILLAIVGLIRRCKSRGTRDLGYEIVLVLMHRLWLKLKSGCKLCLGIESGSGSCISRHRKKSEKVDDHDSARKSGQPS